MLIIILHYEPFQKCLVFSFFMMTNDCVYMEKTITDATLRGVSVSRCDGSFVCDQITQFTPFASSLPARFSNGLSIELSVEPKETQVSLVALFLKFFSPSLHSCPPTHTHINKHVHMYAQHQGKMMNTLCGWAEI